MGVRRQGRSHCVTGLEALEAKARNSALTQPLIIELSAVAGRHRPPGIAEQIRHPHGEAGVADPAREAGDVRRDAGHLGHDDDRRSGAGNEDELGLVLQRHLPAFEVRECIRFSEIDLCHGLGPFLSVGASP